MKAALLLLDVQLPVEYSLINKASQVPTFEYITFTIQLAFQI